MESSAEEGEEIKGQMWIQQRTWPKNPMFCLGYIWTGGKMCATVRWIFILYILADKKRWTYICSYICYIYIGQQPYSSIYFDKIQIFDIKYTLLQCREIQYNESVVKIIINEFINTLILFFFSFIWKPANRRYVFVVVYSVSITIQVTSCTEKV